MQSKQVMERWRSEVRCGDWTEEGREEEENGGYDRMVAYFTSVTAGARGVSSSSTTTAACTADADVPLRMPRVPLQLPQLPSRGSNKVSLKQALLARVASLADADVSPLRIRECRCSCRVEAATALYETGFACRACELSFDLVARAV